MTHKHTPRPWSLSPTPACGLWVDSNTDPICNVVEDNVANAKLIAAAPELLAALLWAIEHAEAYITQQLSDGAVGMRDDLDARDRARAAIAKATS